MKSSRNFRFAGFDRLFSRAPMLCAVAAISIVNPLLGQEAEGLLTSRSDLTAAAQQAEVAANSGGPAGTKNRLLAATIRQRLSDGDFGVGDRIVLSYMSDVRHSDTLVVHGGRTLELPARTMLPLSGVLRSELKDKVATELLKYVKATQIEVTPLTRVGVLGEVAHPGYFALRSDVPLAEAIMVAGGPTATADVERSMVRRGTTEFRSSAETRTAISKGLTLDQFGLAAGDELVIGRKKDFMSGSFMPLVGTVASLAAIFVAVHR